MRISALASHNGSVLQAVIDACNNGTLNAEMALVISNNSNSQALQRARAAHIPTAHLSGATHPDPVALDRAMLTALQSAATDCVLLSGYMKHLGPQTLAAYQPHIFNTHPSLLPNYGGRGFYGAKVHQAVIAAGDTISGATFHRIDTQYDTGEVLAQVTVTVTCDDSAESLEHKVKAAERGLLVNALKEVARNWPQHD